ncbi:MAG: helix-turn-helix domain-containing protein [Pseudomonadota bacterium]
MQLTSEQCRAGGWSQDRLAEKANVSRITVRGFEKGQHCPQRASTEAIIQTLKSAGVHLIGPDKGAGPDVRLALGK